MRLVLQRVIGANVTVDNKIVGQIDHGFVLFLGITHDDTPKDAAWLVQKILRLRLFSEVGGDSFLQKNIQEVKGALLVVSQFTLFGDCKKGTRPSFSDAARPEHAEPLYNEFVRLAKEEGMRVETGIFGASMKVHLENDGPITLIIDSK